MAALDYSKRLQSLQSRRFDQELNESALTKSFLTSDLPPDIKYLFESMHPIGEKYNAKTLQAAENVRKHLERDLNLHFARAYRTQGSVRTNTNIRVHSDFDLLTVIDRYVYVEGTPVNPYTASNPHEDIIELRKQSITIMRNQYDNVDNSGEKCITIENKHLNRKVDIVFAYWYNSKKYDEQKSEYYRGIHLYNFNSKERQKPDFPFATISNVNAKGDSTNDGSRKGIRLLKNLKADSETELNLLKSFHLTCIVHTIDNSLLIYDHGDEIKIATAVSNEMGRLINDSSYRKSIKAPNGLELPLFNDDIVPDLISLKTDLDILIEDATKDIAKSYYVQRSILTY